MAILDLQMRLRELGRIRTGEVITTKKGARAPSKLDHFKITSHSERLIRQVAELYGGTAAPWTPEGSTESQYAVTVTADRIPILVPPQSISQHYELWSGGGCVRRCDGEREQKSGGPCLCPVDPAKRLCSATTRLSVILREVQGLGVFRLDSKGYNAAVELPQVAAFLENAGTYVPAYLALDKRKDVKDGTTRHWLTPVLDVDITPQAMLEAAATGNLGLGPADQRAITPPAARNALTAGLPPSPGPVVIDPESVAAALAQCHTPDELRGLWNELNRDGDLDDPRNVAIGTAFKARAQMISPPPERPHPDPAADFDAHAAAGGRGTEPPATETDPETEQLWQTIMSALPKDWTSEQAEATVEKAIGVPVERATAAQLRGFLETTQRGQS